MGFFKHPDKLNAKKFVLILQLFPRIVMLIISVVIFAVSDSFLYCTSHSLSLSDTEGCEHNWRKFHGHCYRYFTRRHTWEDAEKDCREHSGHLASIHSTQEQDFINGQYQRSYDFQWTDNMDLVRLNWRENQPDNFFAGGEDCVVMIAHENGKWNDVPCNYNLSIFQIQSIPGFLFMSL
uniref:Neurocan core protein-like n=1 Tax=Sinocyclocheilus rhinocerous TaxID=307959 RepID=A0A673JSN9_9TELE